MRYIFQLYHNEGKKYCHIRKKRLSFYLYSAAARINKDNGDNMTDLYNTALYPLRRNGVDLHLSCTKRGADAGKNILLIHGVTYSSHEFDVNVGDYSLCRFFADNGYNVWLLDIAGFGGSGKVADGFTVTSDYAAEDIRAAAEAIIRETGCEKIDVLGWSWGTVTSSRFTASNPSLVRRLVLYAPIMTRIGILQVQDDYHVNTREDAAADFQMKQGGEINYDITEKEVVEAYLEDCRIYDGAGSPNGGRRDILSVEKLIDLGAITVPAFIIYGSKDPYMNLRLLRGISPSEKLSLSEIPGAAHCMMLEKPYYKQFRAEVLAFLNEE